jgi:shikimate dehydrogenase
MLVTKDTLLYGSFSKKAGNLGCKLFNTSFQYYDINAIYKSFSIESIHDAIISTKCLGFSGFAVSMPFKVDVIKYLDEIDDIVRKTNSCNTVVIRNSKLYGYNTDYLSVYEFLKSKLDTISFLYILGNGGYSSTVQSCCKDLAIDYEVITRSNWSKIDVIKNSTIFNCTPLENIPIDSTNYFIDCINTTATGKLLAMKQAAIQFKLYTTREFPLII